MPGSISTLATGELSDLHGELDRVIANGSAKCVMLISIFDPDENPEGYAWELRSRGQCSVVERVYIYEALKLDALKGAIVEE